jgi:hypothetical protein
LRSGKDRTELLEFERALLGCRLRADPRKLNAKRRGLRRIGECPFGQDRVVRPRDGLDDLGDVGGDAALSVRSDEAHQVREELQRDAYEWGHIQSPIENA